jgi:hypothetical protein
LMKRRLPESLVDDTDDALPLLPIKKHTLDKLHCLMRHYAFFTRIVKAKSPDRPRWYVDLFSGPGKCRVEETGEITEPNTYFANRIAVHNKAYSGPGPTGPGCFLTGTPVLLASGGQVRLQKSM